MALSGTIKDFAIADIFQLIGIQRKTGVLTLRHGDETVTIKFLEGRVVEADMASASLEHRIGSVLVRTGRITQKQLDEALGIQRQTLQRLGHILVRREFVSQDELIDALRIQSSEIIYGLFRWRQGDYDFRAVDNLDYDQSHSTPISSETILMEGARMVDEWPIIERRIPSDKVVLNRVAGFELPSEPPPRSGEASPVGEFDLAIDLDQPPAEPGAERAAKPPADSPAGAPELSETEWAVISLVDGRRTVREIADLLPLPEFETFRALSDVVSRKLLVRVEATPLRVAGRAGRGVPALLLGGLGRLVLAAAALLVLVKLPDNRHAPWRLVVAAPASEQLRLYAAKARLERVESALQVFYLDSGSFPEDLRALVDYGYLDVAALTDPWGRPYRLVVSPGGYQVLGLDAAGGMRPELTVSRGFSEVQRLLLEVDGALEPPTP